MPICSTRLDGLSLRLCSMAGRKLWRKGAEVMQRISGHLDPSSPSFLCRSPTPMAVSALDKIEARKALGLSETASVVLWLGRLSVFTKLDPWPTYAILDRVARRLNHPLVLIECGPDDNPSQESSLISLRENCPHVHFHRLGGAEPVSEELNSRPLLQLILPCLWLITHRKHSGLLLQKPWQLVCL